MISLKELIKLARKWQRIAAMKRRRISFRRTNSRRNKNSADTSTLASAGHFVIYSIDERRFVIPLNYLGNNVFRQLLKMSKQVYGLPSEGLIKFPFDAAFMEYMVSLLQRALGKDVEKALLISIETSCCSSAAAFHHGYTSKQLLAWS